MLLFSGLRIRYLALKVYIIQSVDNDYIGGHPHRRLAEGSDISLELQFQHVLLAEAP
jgi:hypothetical protein